MPRSRKDGNGLTRKDKKRFLEVLYDFKENLAPSIPPTDHVEALEHHVKHTIDVRKTRGENNRDAGN